MADNYLAHHGIKGMKWGIRRFENGNYRNSYNPITVVRKSNSTSSAEKKYKSNPSKYNTDVYEENLNYDKRYQNSTGIERKDIRKTDKENYQLLSKEDFSNRVYEGKSFVSTLGKDPIPLASVISADRHRERIEKAKAWLSVLGSAAGVGSAAVGLISSYKTLKKQKSEMK